MKALDTQISSLESQLKYKTKIAEDSLATLKQKIELQKQRNNTEEQRLYNLQDLAEKTRES